MKTTRAKIGKKTPSKKSLGIKKPIIIGNWKMYLASDAEVNTLIRDIALAVYAQNPSASIAFAPSSIHIPAAIKALHTTEQVGARKRLKVQPIALGVQDISHQSTGAQTGSISASSVVSTGASFTLVGHSEVRARGDDAETLRAKVEQAFAQKLSVVYCFGEKVRDEEGTHFKDVMEQLQTLAGIIPPKGASLVLAYEPVWAIGTGKSIIPHDLHEMILYVRKHLASQSNLAHIAKVPILYGGSVQPDTAKDFIYSGKADGLLVGKQSIDARAFMYIITEATGGPKKKIK